MDFFCSEILSGRIPVEILYESSRVMAFRPPQPVWDGHIIVLPRKHITSLTDAARADEKILVELLGIATRFAREVEEEHGSSRVFTDSGDTQVVPHLHFVVHGGARIAPPDDGPAGVS